MTLGFNRLNFWLFTLYFLQTVLVFLEHQSSLHCCAFKTPLHCCCCRIIAEWKRLSGKLSVRKALCLQKCLLSTSSLNAEAFSFLIQLSDDTTLNLYLNLHFYTWALLLIFRACYIYIYWRWFVGVTVNVCKCETFLFDVSIYSSHTLKEREPLHAFISL